MGNISDNTRRKKSNDTFHVKELFPKIVPLMKWCGKIRWNQTGRKWQYKTAHALCILDNKGFKHTLRIRNVYCFSTATVVTRTRLSIKFIRALPVFIDILPYYHLQHILLTRTDDLLCLQLHTMQSW